MNQEELKVFFKDQFANHVKYSADTEFALSIPEKLTGYIDISQALFDAITSVANEQSIIDVFKFSISLSIYLDFSELFIDHRYPNKLEIKDCIGKALQIGSILTDSFKHDGFLELEINSAEISKIKVQEPLKRLEINNISKCALIHLTSTFINLNNTGFVKIEGDVANLICEDLTVEKLVLLLLDTTFLKTAVTFKFFTSESVQLISHNSIEFTSLESDFISISLQLNKYTDFIKIESSNINKLSVDFCKSDCGPIVLKRVKSLKQLNFFSHGRGSQSMIIEKLSIIDSYFEKDFLGEFSKIDFDNGMLFENTTNRGELRFDEIALKKEPLSVVKSVLGKTAFFSCNLTKEIKFDTSNIEEILFYNTKSPKIVKTENHFQPIRRYENEKAVFRQLKIASSKSGDKEESNEFRSKELTAYYQILKLSNVKFFSKENAEKLAILANKSNENGQNWLKTLRLIAIFSFAMYSFFLLSLLIFHETYSLINFDIIKACKYYFDFVIPGYLYPSKNKFSFVADLVGSVSMEFTTLPLVTKLVIYLNDILIMPYLIIQMVSAFRSHIGKE